MDSPGYSAQYCTYTAMENNSKAILTVATVDKRETGKKSSLLEKAGFVRVLKDLKDKKIKVVEVVTDAHNQIGAVMSKINSYIFL